MTTMTFESTEGEKTAHPFVLGKMERCKPGPSEARSHSHIFVIAGFIGGSQPVTRSQRPLNEGTAIV
jgi:hypothetical protein